MAAISIIAITEHNLGHNSPFLRVTPKFIILDFMSIMCQRLITRLSIINTSSYTPTAVSEHFLSTSHTVDDMTLIPIEHLYTKRDSIRKAREAFLIHLGNTLEPVGPVTDRGDEM